MTFRNTPQSRQSVNPAPEQLNASWSRDNSKLIRVTDSNGRRGPRASSRDSAVQTIFLRDSRAETWLEARAANPQDDPARAPGNDRLITISRSERLLAATSPQRRRGINRGRNARHRARPAPNGMGGIPAYRLPVSPTRYQPAMTPALCRRLPIMPTTVGIHAFLVTNESGAPAPATTMNGWVPMGRFQGGCYKVQLTRAGIARTTTPVPSTKHSVCRSHTLTSAKPSSIRPRGTRTGGPQPRP